MASSTPAASMGQGYPLLSAQAKVVSQQVLPLPGHDGLRMELDPLQREAPVPEAHDDPFVGPGGYLQAVRQAFPPDGQGVVPHRLQGATQAGEDPPAVVVDEGHFAMDQLSSPLDNAAVGIADTLMAQAEIRTAHL